MLLFSFLVFFSYIQTSNFKLTPLNFQSFAVYKEAYSAEDNANAGSSPVLTAMGQCRNLQQRDGENLSENGSIFHNSTNKFSRQLLNVQKYSNSLTQNRKTQNLNVPLPQLNILLPPSFLHHLINQVPYVHTSILTNTVVCYVCNVHPFPQL